MLLGKIIERKKGEIPLSAIAEVLDLWNIFDFILCFDIYVLNFK